MVLIEPFSVAGKLFFPPLPLVSDGPAPRKSKLSHLNAAPHQTGLFVLVESRGGGIFTTPLFLAFISSVLLFVRWPFFFKSTSWLIENDDDDWKSIAILLHFTRLSKKIEGIVLVVRDKFLLFLENWKKKDWISLILLFRRKTRRFWKKYSILMIV